MKKLCVLMLVGATALLSGCVAGQKINIAYTPAACARVETDQTASVQVSDQRPYVLNGDKNPQYIGHYRGGYGNTWAVRTASEQPLAQQLKEDILKELNVLGVPVSNAQTSRRLSVKILDYNFDAYMNGRFWYDIEARVLDNANQVLAQAQVKDEHVIKGSFWVGPKYAFQKLVPALHHKIITQLLRDNPDIMNALK